MKRVLTAVVLIPLVLLAVFKAPGWLFGGLIGAVALLAGHEYLGLAAGHGIAPFRKTTLLFIGLYFAGLALFAGQFSWRWISNPDVFAFALV
ncbi:MAG TPA: phosphatidate cytidylyltransferase, partial [Terriglobales bacterium]|nr:phosphatidate cytidylyltransferase [Terriglobales bacterium]